MMLLLSINQSVMKWAAAEAVIFCNPIFCRLHNFTFQADATSHCEWRLFRAGSRLNILFVIRVQILNTQRRPQENHIFMFNKIFY